MSSGRSRRRSRRVLPTVVLLLGVLLTVGTLLPAASYSTGDAGRDATVGVTDDPQAMLGLDTASSVRTGHVDPLVNVTNDFESTATVTVTLNDDSATKVDLVVDGANVGDEYTIDLNRSETVAIDVDVPDDDSYVNDNVVFDVSADGTDIDAVASNRTTTIEDGTT